MQFGRAPTSTGVGKRLYPVPPPRTFSLGLVGAPGRARGGRLPNLATSTWLPNKVPSAGRFPYLVTCLLSRRLGLIYSYSSPVQRAQPTADPLCGASILAHALRHARARIRE